MPTDFNNLYMNPELRQSKALRTMTAPTSFIVLFDFYGKKRSRKRRGNDWEMLNNGELTYTYAEAERKEISRAAFQRALDDLIGRGFIKVSRTGAGVHKLTSLYALSESWKKYGTPDFKVETRKRTGSRYLKVGFQVGHEYYPRQQGGNNANE